MRVENYSDTTLVSNVFIDQYLAYANEAQIKVYLYLLRMYSVGRCPENLQEIADELDFPVGDIKRSLKYWEIKGAINTGYDERGELISIGLNHLTNASKQKYREIFHAVDKEPLTDVQDDSADTSDEDVSNEENVVSTEADITAVKESEEYEDVSFPGTFVDVPPKTGHGSDDMVIFEKEMNGKELVDIAQTYLQRLLSGSDLQSLMYYRIDLGFSQEVVDILLQYAKSLDEQSESNKTNFHYIDAIAKSWYRKGVKTAEDAKRAARFSDKDVKEILASIGRYANPMPGERIMIMSWFYDGFSREVILYACSQAINTDSGRLQYVNKIIQRWKSNGLYDLEKIKESEKRFREERDKLNESKYGQKKSYRKPKRPVNVDNYSYKPIDQNEILKRALEEE